AFRSSIALAMGSVHLIIDSFIDRISRMHTQRGLEVTTGSIEAVDSINYFHEQVLSSGQNLE
ncbi:hypothetical protein, partial [Citrobacter youngae]|uniref:hypothetical protein n=1 Tax=Citrobacter youngae TaxID=133448 RepID=UPI001953B8DF